MLAFSTAHRHWDIREIVQLRSREARVPVPRRSQVVSRVARERSVFGTWERTHGLLSTCQMEPCIFFLSEISRLPLLGYQKELSNNIIPLSFDSLSHADC